MTIRRSSAAAIFCLALDLIACETEDPGPVQNFEKEFYDVDFERLEVGSALDVRVEQFQHLQHQREWRPEEH
jgi:hypothetical protein